MDNFISLNDDYTMPYGSSYLQQDGDKCTAHTFGDSWTLGLSQTLSTLLCP